MENYFKEDALFYIIPEDIKNLSVFKLCKDADDFLVFTADDEISGIKDGENLEFFSGNNNGILYFKAPAESFNEGSLTIKKPVDIEVLQRRENERVIINEIISLFDTEQNKISALLKDLSVGGMKIHTKEQLVINDEYNCILNFDNLNLKLSFVPSRISYESVDDKGTYITSGKLYLSSPKDKIELVQYCYRKYFEQTNRG